MPTPVPNQVRVTHRLNRKTTVACFQGHRLRGQCKNQSVSKYDQEVRHLVGKARRKALQRLYERSRANPLPHAKPVGGARQIQHAVQVACLSSRPSQSDPAASRLNMLGRCRILQGVALTSLLLILLAKRARAFWFMTSGWRWLR